MRQIIISFCLFLSAMSLQAYARLDIPITTEMSRAEVEQVLGKPGFLIYNNVRIQGIAQPVEVSLSGYRIDDKNSPGRLITLVFFQDTIQLAVSVFYGEKVQQSLLRKVIRNANKIKKINVRGLKGYLDEKTLDLFLAEQVDGSHGFPPADLQKYLQSEKFMNDDIMDKLVIQLAAQIKPQTAEPLSSLTYMNLRLIASVATQGLLTPSWRK